VALDVALRQRARAVRAGVVHHIERAVDVEHREREPVRLDLERGPLGDIAGRAQFHFLSHAFANRSQSRVSIDGFSAAGVACFLTAEQRSVYKNNASGAAPAVYWVRVGCPTDAGARRAEHDEALDAAQGTERPPDPDRSRHADG